MAHTLEPRTSPVPGRAPRSRRRSSAPGESVAEVCAPSHDGQTLWMSGYLVPPLITTGCRESCSMYVSDDRGAPGGVMVTFPVGAGPRTMDAIGGSGPGAVRGQVERLREDAWRLRDDAGAEVGPGDEVRVRGALNVVEIDGEPECSMRPLEVHAL